MTTEGSEMLDVLTELSDMLVADPDPDADRLLQWVTGQCLRRLDVQAAGILLADHGGALRALAVAPESASRVRLFEAAPAPGTWSFGTGETMADADLGRPDRRWTVFAGDARTDGFSSVTAVPMRIRGEIIGVVSVLRDRTGHLSDETLRLMRALTNAASAGLIVHRDPDWREVLAAQLQRALTGRTAVEQARGILAELLGVDVDVALDALRRHAARTGRSLPEAATDVVNAQPRAEPVTGIEPVLLVQSVTATTQAGLRAQVRRQLAAAGLTGSALDSFLLAVHEAAANAQEHGSGGRLWLWRHAGRVWCEISDDGPGLPADFTVHTGAPPSGGLQHTGLWLIHRICPDVEITSGPGGTRLLMSHPLPGRSAGPVTSARG